MPRKQAESTDCVLFNGIKFRRYPNSKRTGDRRYYRASGCYRKQGISYLHREVWKFYNGEIPEGYHVHHIDGNFLNNDISNLELLEGTSHLSERASNEEWRKRNSEHLDEVREKAAQWHKSPEGREWHVKHGIEVAQKEASKAKVECVCVVCGKKIYAFGSKAKIRKYCSKACYAKYRRDSKIDHEVRECPICGKSFSVNRFSKTKTCSKECGVRSMLLSRENKTRRL